jgi:hypothetical protein
MSAYLKNSYTLYFRPITAIPRYQVAQCAQWLHRIGRFRNATEANIWLMTIEEADPWFYKSVMSSYFEHNDVYFNSAVYRDVSKFRSADTAYNNDEHIGWSF